MIVLNSDIFFELKKINCTLGGSKNHEIFSSCRIILKTFVAKKDMKFSFRVNREVQFILGPERN
jgi:hypothetical protein